MALAGQNTHIHKNKKAFDGSQLSPINEKLRYAQYVIDSSSPDKDLSSLVKTMYKSRIKAHLENVDGLETFLNSICEWSWSEQSASKLGSNVYMQLSDWQQELVDNIRHLNPGKVYMFSENGVNYFWVVIESPSSKNIKAYLKIYVETLDRYPDALCDFLVYGNDEIHEESLPETVCIIEAGSI
jgi:hypothetical protein